MSRRPDLLHLASALLLATAVLLPLGLGIAGSVPARADLRWSFIDADHRSAKAPEITPFDYGFTIHLENAGNAPVERIELLLPREPADVFAFLPDGTILSSADRDGDHVLALGPFPAESWGDLRVFGITGFDLDRVTADGQPVEETRIERPRFRQTPWLPNWAILSGALSLAGLLLQSLRLRRDLYS